MPKLNIFKKESTSKNYLYKIIPKFYSFRQQLHIYHLQTDNYARHKATDELLEALTNFIDEFVETYSGKYGKVNFKEEMTITLSNLDDQDAVDYLDIMIEYFIEKLPTYLNSKYDSDLLNLRDEIVATTNKTKYLFTLN
jgi:DNA-binding ferritin-like protein